MAACNPSKDSSLQDLALMLYHHKFQGYRLDQSKLSISERPENPEAQRALTTSCFHGHVHVAETLLGSIIVTKARIEPALYWAPLQGHTRCLEVPQPSMSSNIDVSICKRVGRSALAAAAANGYLYCLDYFLYTNLFDIKKQGANGMAPSSSAVTNSYDHLVAALLRKDLWPGLEVGKMDFES